MSVTGGIMAGVGLAGSLGGAAISSSAAQSAASAQSQAAEQAAQLQYQASQNALGFQEQQYNTGQAELQPFLQSGTGALSNLDYLMGVQPQPAGYSASSTIPGAPAAPSGAQPVLSQQPSRNGVATNTSLATQAPRMPGEPSFAAPGQGAGNPAPGPGGGQVPGAGLAGAGSSPAPFSASPSASSPGGYGSLLAPYPGTFSAPTAEQALNSPGEQAQLQLGEQAMQQSAAAQGNLLTGGTAEALDAYGQNLASTNYQNVYNDAYNTYAAGYNQYQNQQANEFNRLSALVGGGQTAANTLGTLGANAAQGVSNNVLGTASQMGQDTQNAAAANASGMVGSANAYSGALGNIGGNIGQLALLNQLYGGGSSGNITNQNELTGGGF